MENLIQNEIIIKCGLEEIIKAFFEDYVIVWHDPKINNEENQKYIAQLKKFCEVFPFKDWQNAKNFVEKAQVSCHVITSGSNGELLVKEIFMNQNIENIYIFCGDKNAHSPWAKNYQKVLCIETTIQDLVYEIQESLLEWHQKKSSLRLNLPAFAPIFNDSDKSQMNHLHRYLKVIPNFKNRDQAKEDFLALSKRIYQDSKTIELILDFEQNYLNYDKEEILKWYTRESFLYKVTNNCLRIATSDSIQYCRLLVKDLERAIKEQYQTKSKKFNRLLYRGAYLSEKEWENLKNNLDKEVEMHGFLSVSKEKNIALNFMESDPSKKVLITIIVPKGPNEEEQGFAEVEEFSDFHGEREVLFNVRSRFTVLETEDLPYRHLVLLYGAQGFRKFVTEQEEMSMPEVPLSNIEDILCAHCQIRSFDFPEKIFFVSITKQIYYCKKCVDYGIGPFLCVSTATAVNASKRKIKFKKNLQFSCKRFAMESLDKLSKEEVESLIELSEIRVKCSFNERLKEFKEKSLHILCNLHVNDQEDLVEAILKGLEERILAFDANHIAEENLKEVIIKFKSLEDMIKTYYENDAIAMLHNYKAKYQENQKEIIIKCDLEEMVKVFFEEYVIVWHDPKVYNEENQQHIAQLKRFCKVFPFTKWEETKDFLEKTQVSCHVITSGTNGELLVKEIAMKQKVENIYIFCQDKDLHSSWAKNYSKISCIETDIQNLVNQIQENLLEWYKKSCLKLNLPAFAPIFDDSDKSQMNHLHRSLKVLPNFQNRDQAKDDFLVLSKMIFQDSENIKLIAEFEEKYQKYDKKQILEWYTRDSFFHKVTNNCLRIATSDSVQYCR